MRWMNGNGEWGNGQGLANQLNNDANTNLTIRAIDGNRDACKILEGEDEYNSYKSSSRLSKSEEMDYNFHLAKVCCILCDYFKTEGLNPESYLNEVTRYKREER